MEASFPEEDYVTLSALQHFVFCPRQCALIYTEQLWKDNALTTFGHLEHRRVDTAPDSVRGGVRIARSVRLVSRTLGLRGVSDVVEYHDLPQGTLIIPVEYKHGRPAEHGADAVQLCAQALCLEEMHRCRIPSGYLYYQSLRRRVETVFTEELREQVRAAVEGTRRLLQERTLPPAARRGACGACSLAELCLPASCDLSAREYNRTAFETALTEEGNAP